MPGRGPAPKDPRKRARANKDPIPTRIVEVDGIEPPELPDDLLPGGDEWHPATMRWWRTWCESPLAADLPAVDWAEFELLAVLHHEFMRKRTFTLASELRLRIAKFGATPEDRARLRIQIADADARDARRPQAPPASRERFGDLRVLRPKDGEEKTG